VSEKSGRGCGALPRLRIILAPNLAKKTAR